MVISLLDNGKKKKQSKSDPEIPEHIEEAEEKFVYRNSDGSYVFTPMYEVYVDTYMREIVAGTKIKTAYELFSDTAWFEKYMTNTYQFAAAKDAAICQLLQKNVYDEKGKLRSWSKFKDKADEIVHNPNKTWLRVERDNVTRQSIMADRFTDLRADADLYPYWKYVGRMDSRERPEHVALEGMIFRIGSPAGDRVFPPNDWNCRCTAEPVDDMWLKQTNGRVQTEEEANKWLYGIDPSTGKAYVDEQFRYNPADQGMMPKQGTYFTDSGVFSANDLNASKFGIAGDIDPELEGYAATMLPHVPSVVAEWRNKYHTDRLGNVIFQNVALLANIWLTEHSIRNIHKHPRGIEALPKCVTDPAEVWSRWESVDKQQVVFRNYIWIGKQTTYVVQTRDGAIQDGFLVSRASAEKYRNGVVWLK